MRKSFLSLTIVLAAAAPARAGAFEEAAIRARLNFVRALGAFKLQPLQLRRGALAQGAKAAAAADLAALFDKGDKPASERLMGWHAGRRFTKGGPMAALLVGTKVYKDPAVGPLSGEEFKVILMGSNIFDKDLLVDIYDEPGSELANTVITLIRENASKWSAADFKEKEKSVVTRKEGAALEVRVSGDYLVCKYDDGTYGYFFKKVRGLVAQAGAKFRYDPATGLCLDSLGQAGMNRVTLQELQKGKDGECADLGDIRLNGDDLSYPKLTGWNLRGADMRKARLHFAHLLDADLRGALMEGFDFGYAKVTGTVDRFTRQPQTGCTVKESTRLECFQ